MTATGPGTFYDGLTSARNAVTVALDDDTVRIGAADGTTLAQWRTAEIAPVSTPEGVLRVGLARRDATARLEIHDAQLAAAVVQAARPCDRTGMTDHRTRVRIAAYSLVAIVVLVSAGIWGVPIIADKVTPLLPIVIDERIGVLANAEERRELSGETHGKPFECSVGTSAKEQTARAAFTKLVGMLEGAAGLPLPTEVYMVHVSDINAVTVPGGFIYVYEGILSKAMRVDEVAGVIGHEMGHVDHRDGTKTAVQSGGMSVLFGLLLGDFTGGGAVVFTATKAPEPRLFPQGRIRGGSFRRRIDGQDRRRPPCARRSVATHVLQQRTPGALSARPSGGAAARRRNRSRAAALAHEGTVDPGRVDGA